MTIANTIAYFVTASATKKNSFTATANTLAYFIAESVTKRVL
jgi:hypothetical protein